MEIFGLLFGVVFWLVVLLGVWLLVCRVAKLKRQVRIGGFLALLVLPALAVISTSWYCFVEEGLLSAAAEGDAPKARFLLSLGANSNIEANGFTALGFAVANNKTEVVRLLLASGADANKPCWLDKRSSLTIAKQNRNRVVVELLQNAGATQ